MTASSATTTSSGNSGRGGVLAEVDTALNSNFRLRFLQRKNPAQKCISENVTSSHISISFPIFSQALFNAPGVSPARSVLRASVHICSLKSDLKHGANIKIVQRLLSPYLQVRFVICALFTRSVFIGSGFFNLSSLFFVWNNLLSQTFRKCAEQLLGCLERWEPSCLVVQLRYTLPPLTSSSFDVVSGLKLYENIYSVQIYIQRGKLDTNTSSTSVQTSLCSEGIAAL